MFVQIKNSSLKIISEEFRFVNFFGFKSFSLVLPNRYKLYLYFEKYAIYKKIKLFNFT